MKRTLTLLLAGAAAILALYSCNKDVDEPETPADTPDITDAVAPVLDALENDAYVLEENGDFATFTWTAADFNTDADIAYTLTATCEGSDDATVGSVTNDTELTVSANEINTILLANFSCEAGTSCEIGFYLTATCSGASLTSNSISATLTPFEAYVAPNLTHDYIYITGDLNADAYGSWQFTGPFLYDYADEGQYYHGVVDFTEDYKTLQYGFKITNAADWDHTTLGSNDSENTEGSNPDEYQLAVSGDNILVYQGAKRYYHFTVDMFNNTITRNYGFDSCTLNLAGSEYDLTYSLATQRFYVDVTSATGAASVSLDGTELFSSELSTEGTARIYVDFNNLDAMTISADTEAYGSDADEQEEESGDPLYETWQLAGDFSEWAYLATTAYGTDGYVYTGLSATAGDEYGFHDLYNIWYAADWSLVNTDTDNDGDNDRYTPTVGESFAISSTSYANAVIPADGTYDIYVFPDKGISYLMNTGDEPESSDNSGNEGDDNQDNNNEEGGD